jgi:signal transduction histidine kinase
MVKKTGLSRSRVLTWLAGGMFASACVLAWYGYRATRQWQRSSVLLNQQRAAQTADLLVTALTRDMHAVQRLVLPSADWNRLLQDPLYDFTTAVASAFARYPYPETFFAARADLRPGEMLFFTRSNRPPPWVPPGAESNRFPVTPLTEPGLATALVERIVPEAVNRRRFAIFGIRTADTSYQVIAHLRYRGPSDDHLDSIFGFMVNMTWARAHYFQELTNQVARIGGPTAGLSLAIVDDQGVRVASTASGPWDGQVSRRFSVTFFDPLLVAVAQPKDLPRWEWAVQVGGTADPTLADAIHGADRTLVLAAFAAGALAVGLVMTARALSARDRLAELRTEFVSTVTHELKTPIASIRALGDTLVSGRIQTQDGQREYAQLVVREAKRLTRLVDNLLALSRITDVTDVYWFEPLSLEALVEETLKEFESQMEAAGFQTHVNIPVDLPSIQADRTAMALLLDNLVDNAIRYSPAARSLTISAVQDNGHVVLNVADCGRGIPADEIEQITRRFFRGRDGGSNGSGLGLAIVQRIVNDHHGSLEIASAAEVGTTVRVRLPVANVDEQADSDR